MYDNNGTKEEESDSEPYRFNLKIVLNKDMYCNL